MQAGAEVNGLVDMHLSFALSIRPRDLMFILHRARQISFAFPRTSSYYSREGLRLRSLLENDRLFWGSSRGNVLFTECGVLVPDAEQESVMARSRGMNRRSQVPQYARYAFDLTDVLY